MGKELNLLIGVREENLPELLKYHSYRNNLEVKTFTATSGKQLRTKLKQRNYDGVISDYFLGDETAIEILKDEKIDIPFIIHTKYYNSLLKNKASGLGALGMFEKKESFDYFNKILHKISEVSSTEELEKTERADLKFRIDEDGRILQANRVVSSEIGAESHISGISENLEDEQVMEVIGETLELGTSSIEAVIEDGKGIVNYRLSFHRLENATGLSVTGLPIQELEKVDMELYTEARNISEQKVVD